MIFQREMAKAFDQELSTTNHIEAVNFLNRRLKLPPISTNTNVVGRSSPRENVALISEAAVSLPRLDLHSFSVCNRDYRHSKLTTGRSATDLDATTVSFPRVYSVLPPIGQTLTPLAPTARRETKIPNSVYSKDNPKTELSRTKRSTRRHRLKIPIPDSSTRTETVSNPTLVVDTSPVNIKTTVDAVQPNESGFCIDISDPCPTRLAVAPGVDSPIVEEKDEPVLEDSPELNHIPKELRLYADVYPISPPPDDRRAKNLVERTRQLLDEENCMRLEFMEELGNRRRNATCVELDEALKNAVELLRELFLRKTMEELCMLW